MYPNIWCDIFKCKNLESKQGHNLCALCIQHKVCNVLFSVLKKNRIVFFFYLVKTCSFFLFMKRNNKVSGYYESSSRSPYCSLPPFTGPVGSLPVFTVNRAMVWPCLVKHHIKISQTDEIHSPFAASKSDKLQGRRNQSMRCAARLANFSHNQTMGLARQNNQTGW